MGVTKEERLRRLEERFQEMNKYERRLRAEGRKAIGGVDEVGRRPLAGPVVAACVVLPEDFDVRGIDDSKKLSEKKREELYEMIMEKALAVGIGRESNELIDEINILEATKVAMKKAIAAADEALRKAAAGSSAQPPSGRPGAAAAAPGEASAPPLGALPPVQAPSPAAVDFVIFDAMEIPEIGKPQLSLVKGDSKSISVAAASIIAKVTRDRLMVEMDKLYPGYGFASNKGYGTKAHYEGIKEQGITPIHRRSFLKGVI